MSNIAVSCILGIGFANAHRQEDFELEFTVEEWENFTEEERQKILDETAMEWANNYIDVGITVI